MDQIYGPGEIRVNSDHHMAVDQLASCFRVGAASPDGVVEAYESIDDSWFCIGVQFHPENQTASALDMQVFDAFMEGCTAQDPSRLSSQCRLHRSRRLRSSKLLSEQPRCLSFATIHALN